MQALGTIEVVGLVAGIEAADVAAKAANVKLIGYELAKGGGYVTIKVMGDVGAVKAAMDAAEVAAAKLTRVVSKLVIPRPAAQLEQLVYSAATVGYVPEVAEPEAPAPEPTPEPAEAENQPEPADEAPADSEEAKPAPRTTNRRKKS